MTLYHQRWEIETAYLEIKSTILGGGVLRARTPQGLDQEIHALLVTYQLLRLAMADATACQPGTDPDRASFTIALNTARDLVIQATAVITGTTIDLLGTIGYHVLANLMPDRRIRTHPRIVKRAISKYNARATPPRPGTATRPAPSAPHRRTVPLATRWRESRSAYESRSASSPGSHCPASP